MKKQNWMNLLRCISFLAVAVMLVSFLSLWLQRNTFTGAWNYMAKMNEFYGLERDSLDYICVGSSHAYCTVNPLEIWDESNLKGFTLATQEQPLVVSYHYLKEAFKTQSPKVVFLEGFMGYTTAKTEAALYTAADSMRFSWNKLQMIHAMAEPDQRENYYFNFLKYHSRWKDVAFKELDTALQYPQDLHKGFAPVHGTKPYGNIIPDYNAVTAEMPEETRIRLNEIHALTEKNGAELVLLIAPFGDREEVTAAMKAEREWAAEKNVRVVDLALMAEELGLAPEDYYDSAHLDVSGAAKASRYLATVLKEYSLSPSSDEKWDADYQAFAKAQKGETP
ncbi:MAG: hypothetical protein IJP27_06870 [Clostridia bacterium]|nr:hypothetical protein [Clostridia bacterium]